MSDDNEELLCRLCAEYKKNFIGIYDSEGQKNILEEKIIKCLHIDILIEDGLPSIVCLDCFYLLNQFHDFYEKTRQAQESLHQLFFKSEEAITDAQCDDDKTDSYTKQEDNDEASTPQDFAQGDDEYIEEDVNDVDSKLELEDLPKERKTKPATKKSTRQAKKKGRRKSNVKSEVEFGSVSDVEDDHTYGGKVISKIPENYMTGTDSDIESLEAQTKSEASKSGRNKNSTERHPWLCTDCNDKLPSLEALEKHHASVHNQIAKYMCVKCCKVYEKYYGFLTHVKRHKTSAKFNCEDCGKSFVHKKVLDSHKAVHCEERPHVCQTCGKAFRQQSALYIHSRCHLPENMKNRFPCDECDKRFSTKPNLVTHKRIHSGVRNFTCDQCGKSFIQKGNLEAHFLTHSLVKPYSCTQCSKAFKTPLQLKKHESVHTGARPHQCAVCGRTFREKGTLREHHRIHTGAMPFTCEFCGKCFRFKGILTTHRRQHTGERPYSCVECQHHFTNWPNYNKHMKRRHGINTSHTKYQPPPQQEQTAITTSEEQIVIPIQEPHPVQVIQSVSHASIQPLVIQEIPTTSKQLFLSEVSSTSDINERNSYFVPTTTIQNYLTPNLSFNFYNITNVADAEVTSIIPS